jgi:putative DNA primase/helicase
MTPVREAARGRWRGILPALGIDARYLTSKHGPCPICQDGTDRWRFDDKEGSGSWFCSAGHSGKNAGDGVSLVMLANNLDFKAAAQAIEKLAGVAPVAPVAKREDPAKARERMNALWRSGKPLTAVPAVREWWSHRLGETPVCRDLRAVGALKYQDGVEGDATQHPAMLALVRDAAGKPANLHRTYLAGGGRKAEVPKPRKMTSGVSLLPGSAVQLMPYTDILGIAEGIETAFAASRLFRVPCWAALNASNLQGWTPPEGVRVLVFGDNDATKRFTGQRAAYALADRLAGAGVSVEVHIPNSAGDWNDALWRVRHIPETPVPEPVYPIDGSAA